MRKNKIVINFIYTLPCTAFLGQTSISMKIIQKKVKDSRYWKSDFKFEIYAKKIVKRHFTHEPSITFMWWYREHRIESGSGRWWPGMARSRQDVPRDKDHLLTIVAAAGLISLVLLMLFILLLLHIDAAASDAAAAASAALQLMQFVQD